MVVLIFKDYFMKKFLLLLLFLPVISWQNLLAQSDYTLTIEREGVAASYCAIATENNEVIAVIRRYGEDGTAELIRIDANGNIIDSLVFSPPTNQNPDIWSPLDLRFFNDTEFIRLGSISTPYNDGCLQGQLLLTQQNRKEVNTGKLPPSCYIYRIIAENGEATNGKWVKK